MSDEAVSVQALYVHPVKSCGAIEVREALVIETGFELDRAWMVVDANGEFLSQRDRFGLSRIELAHDLGDTGGIRRRLNANARDRGDARAELHARARAGASISSSSAPS